LEGCGFESHPILDGNGVKAMPGLIFTPNPGSFNNWKESQMGHTKKNFLMCWIFTSNRVCQESS